MFKIFVIKSRTAVSGLQSKKMIVAVVVVAVVASHKLVGDYPSIGRAYWLHKT